MTYRLGQHSRAELRGVHPSVVRLTERAIVLTKQDFTVHDGLRSVREQAEYVRTGVSRTMASLHLPQDDSYGHAVDLVPYINGHLRWELPACLEIALAVRAAALELSVPIRWGGSWERLDGDSRHPGLMVEDYVKRRRREGRHPFVDAAHFELAS